MSLAERQPVAWVSDVLLKGAAEPTRIMFVERRGPKVVVRQVDRCDPEPERVPVYEGDELVAMTPIAAVTMHNSPVVGETRDLEFAIRITEVRREAGTVYVRTLRRDEEDNGARVHLMPGERVAFDAGGLRVELDYLDGLEPVTEFGYRPVTPALALWYSLGQGPPEKARYLVAAARRLDTANRLLATVERTRAEISREDTAAPALRRAAFELIGSVEAAVVALHRVTDMICRLPSALNDSHQVPAVVTRLNPTIKRIRDAYEHIDERALGLSQRRVDPLALTIFDHGRLLSSNTIVYGKYVLRLQDEVPEVIAAARAFLLDVAGN